MYNNSYPIPITAYSVNEAPYVYTSLGEAIGRAHHTEDRTAGTIACFGGEPLQPGVTARAWLKAGYVKER